MYYIYLFVVKDTQEVIYVGSTLSIGERLNEHRRSFREKRREQPIHKYMKLNDLELLTDVSYSVVDFAESKEEALKKEGMYFDLHRETTANVWKADERDGVKSPVRKTVKSKKDGTVFNSMNAAAKHYGVTRHQIYKMVDNGELVEVDIDSKYINVDTGEKFISGYQLQNRYNVDSKRIWELSKTGELILNGMTIRKV